MTRTKNLSSLLKSTTDKNFQDLHWTGSFDEYLSIVDDQPLVTRNSYQRMYDMIMSYGTEDYRYCKQSGTKYKFFSTIKNC